MVYEAYRVRENQYVMLKRSSGEDGFTEDAGRGWLYGGCWQRISVAPLPDPRFRKGKFRDGF